MTTTPLIEQICWHYGVSARFATAYLQHLNIEVDSLEALMALPEPMRTWFDHAMTSNQRGETWLNWLLPHLSVDAHRCLDLECELGGLIVALARRGFQAFGFTSDETVGLARANCHDHGLLSLVYEGSPLVSSLINTSCQFDLITLLDGAAAANHAQRLIAFAAHHLRPGGVLVFNAPNPNGIAQIDSSAEYHTLGFYIRLCEQYGGRCEVFDSTTSYLRRLSEISALRVHNVDTTQDTPIGVAWQQTQRRSSRIDRLSRDYLELPPDQFAERYLRDTWTLIVRFS